MKSDFDINEKPMELADAIAVLKERDAENIEDESVGIFLDREFKRAVPTLLAVIENAKALCYHCGHVGDLSCGDCFGFSRWVP
jgi:hypothetical protein